ncbi:phosphatidylserine/phosphatidylglycerophosphate/cardiolipin synthase-like enzyme [Streptomyces umbrinus]|uniref:Phosphatidylserine/phosphatidylglycerophosphate/ cardiolipin synthase-like enzyme n=1 Tax=Streptomyces umbrinus TaxID=67370 RepID=A0ABU0SMN2_9ACTN|nr:phospholipase D-like domain-containing protein [Streptomyces umbrinus]MDQ1024811.1 phosphatidylserine/phosphatidylglycerophosphate/cardiolipin synthase-like enzyme [Streptomyces umbrinus]
MTDRLDLGALVHDDGYFLVREPKGTREPYLSNNEGTGGTYRHVLTYPASRRTIKEAALELIQSARHKVFLASYLLGETELLQALFEAADRLRGGVYVVSELSDQSLRRKLTELEDSADPDAATQTHKKYFAELTSHGIAVRGRPDCHAKFLIVDDRAALVSSANLDTNGLNSIGENGAVVTDAIEVDRLSRFFTRLWDSCAYEMPAGSAGYSVRKHAPAPSRCRVPVPQISTRPGIIWTNGDEQLILDHLHDVIARARTTLLLATYSLQGMADSPDILLDPLVKAMRDQPLRVSLLCRGRNHPPSQRRDAAALTELGVRIHADSTNHAKGAIADKRHGALFSANFDADHGLLNGVETGVRLDGEAALTQAVHYFGHAMTHADLEFVPHPTQHQLDQRLAARWRSPWRGERTVRVTASDRVWQRFVTEVQRAPVLYEREVDGRIRLYAGQSGWTLSTRRPTGATGARILRQADTPQTGTLVTHSTAHELLERWLASRGDGVAKTVKRGFLPAIIERQRGHPGR